MILGGQGESRSKRQQIYGISMHVNAQPINANLFVLLLLYVLELFVSIQYVPNLLGNCVTMFCFL